MKQWYALHTKTQYEKRVAQRLEERGIDVFLPQMPVEKDRSASGQTALFPGYLFVRLDLDVDATGHWRWAPGVRYLVGYGERPVAVPEPVIAFLAHEVARMHKSGPPPEFPFNKGDHVRVKHGPFSGLIGIFNSPASPAKRVEVLLQALQGAIRLQIAPSSLEKVAPEQVQTEKKRGRRTRGRGRRIRNS